MLKAVDFYKVIWISTFESNDSFITKGPKPDESYWKTRAKHKMKVRIIKLVTDGSEFLEVLYPQLSQRMILNHKLRLFWAELLL